MRTFILSLSPVAILGRRLFWLEITLVETYCLIALVMVWLMESVISLLYVWLIIIDITGRWYIITDISLEEISLEDISLENISIFNNILLNERWL